MKLPLARQSCRPCESGEPALSAGDIRRLRRQIHGWSVGRDGKLLFQEWRMKDFITAVDLINKITRIAQQQDHHPDIHLTGYRNLRIELATHSIGGLSLNDFILAAKIDKLPKKLKRASR